MGDEALGIITALHYSEALDNPANKKFVKAFREKAKKAASYYSEGTYTGTRWIIEAIKAIDGDVENNRRFLEALRKVQLKDVPRGPFTVDDYGNPIQNLDIRKVERVGRGASEYGDPYLSQRFPVLEIQTRGVFETTCL